MWSISDFVKSQDSLIKFGLIAAVGALVITLFLILYILALHLLQVIANRNKRHLHAVWRPNLATCALNIPKTLPRLRHWDQLEILSLWNHYYEILRGEARTNLISLARKIQLDAIARRQLFHADRKHRLLAILTLGNMRSREDWPLLNQFLHNADTYISLVSLRACFHIHPERAATTLLPYLITRSDYPPAQVGTLLRDFDNTKLCPHLGLHMMLNLSNNSTNILRYMQVCGCDINRQIFQAIIEQQHDDQVISTALSILDDPSAIDLISRFVDHPRWHIRVHVAMALGKLAKREQLPMLLKLISDPEWWVRYRAAQALAGLPFMNKQELQDLITSLDDRYASDILQQALAEDVP